VKKLIHETSKDPTINGEGERVQQVVLEAVYLLSPSTSVIDHP